MVDRRVRARGCSMGCMSSGNGDRESMMRKLQKIDFALVEINLYLDAYPHCEKGLAYYHKLCEEREMLVAAMGESGKPITMRDNKSVASWDWIKSPWPWHGESDLEVR
ncbi:MAG: spore coat protein CotJB [Clostridia bacterium]|nr:spore coat protein CotJB [Clostridia bacterium]